MKINIKTIMDKKNISRYKLAKQLDMTYPTVDNLYKGKTTSIKLDTLEKLCDTLECNPQDILVRDPIRFDSEDNNDTNK